MKPSSGIEPQVIGLDARRRWGILAICCTSLFVVGLDTTIVNVALPTIGEGFRVGTRGLEWVVNAYTLVLASLLISSGAVADRFGRRRVFQIGLVVFGGGVDCLRTRSVRGGADRGADRPRRRWVDAQSGCLGDRGQRDDRPEGAGQGDRGCGPRSSA